MRLNLGCQVHHFDGWTNQDIVSNDPNIKAEIYSDAINLPIEDGVADFIYAGHLVEHFYPDTVQKAIAEWYRVLKHGGKLVIVTPDCGQAFIDYAQGKFNIESTWQQVYGRIYSYDGESERHHMAFDFGSLVSVVSTMPWADKKKMDFNSPPEELAPFMDLHISRGAYQLGIILTK